MEFKFFDTAAAAEILGVRPNTLERWRWQGVGPSYRKFGKLVRYDERDLSAYVEAQSRTSTSQKQAA